MALCCWSRLRPQIALSGPVQPGAEVGGHRVLVGVVPVHDGLREGQRLGVEVHVVPPREGPAPVEDHRVHRHGVNLTAGWFRGARPVHVDRSAAERQPNRCRARG